MPYEKKAPADAGARPVFEKTFCLVGLLRAPCRVALAAVNGLSVRGVEGNLRLLAAAVASHVVERPLPSFTRGGLALVAAHLAPLRLVGESLAGVELLIVCRKQKRATAINAGQILVRVLLHH